MAKRFLKHYHAVVISCISIRKTGQKLSGSGQLRCLNFILKSKNHINFVANFAIGIARKMLAEVLLKCVQSCVCDIRKLKKKMCWKWTILVLWLSGLRV